MALARAARGTVSPVWGRGRSKRADKKTAQRGSARVRYAKFG